MTDGTLNRISMLTGENTAHVRYSDDMLPENSEKKFSYSDYTVLNDEIFFSNSALKLCRYDASAQTINECSGDDGFMYLYSDGKNIYTVYKIYNGTMSELHFGKVTIDGSNENVDIIIQRCNNEIQAVFCNCNMLFGFTLDFGLRKFRWRQR